MAAATTASPPLQQWGDISWTAAEFVEHEKSASWYLALALVGGVVAAIAYLISHDKITTGVIVFVMVGFGLLAARRPREQHYRLTAQGVQIGNRAYGFQDFRTFSVTEDGSIVSIVFTPLKRFMPALTIYVAPNLEEQVVQFLSAFLPFERHRVDAVDSLMRRIRF
jgi:hypothetical protein